MPPPSYNTNINSRSANDQGNDNDFENTKSEISISKQENKTGLKSETVGIVKSLLGPSLEDAVLRTLEFGKSLMQKSELEEEHISKETKLIKKFAKELTPGSSKDSTLEYLLEERERCVLKGIKNGSGEKAERKDLALAAKMDKEYMYEKPNSCVRKHVNVSKIRSLDSDLKQNAPSPEKIKKQLEALIQINKNELSEHSWNNLATKQQKMPVEMTVMPSLCMYKNETDINYASSCDVQSQASRGGNEGNETTSRMRSTAKKRPPNKICQAPEFLSNALGPTIDVSIIDNLKMMRDIFKYDSGKGEGHVKEQISQQMKHEIRLQNSEGEMTCRIEGLQKKIEELELKEQCLIKQIEEDENQRECKRREFQEEEKKLSGIKNCLETLSLSEGRKGGSGKSLVECNVDAKVVDAKVDDAKVVDSKVVDAKVEALHARIANEEERLSRVKCQYDHYKRELAEAKCKREALKRNKCLLDAWDIFASRVCHTKLPSFSRAYNLERKQFKADDAVNLHCCFPTVPSISEPKKSASSKSFNRLHSNRSEAGSQSDVSREQESQANLKCKMKMGEIQFPIQRDIACGLHQMLKTCTCTTKSGARVAGQGVCSSEDDMLKKYKGTCQSPRACKHSYATGLGLDSSAEIILKKASGDKPVSRSKSDTSLKNDKCSKIVKVMWAVTRINIFQNNYRTYEIMDATCTPPPSIPVKTEGIFVVKTPQRNVCGSPSRKKCCHKTSGY